MASDKSVVPATQQGCDSGDLHSAFHVLAETLFNEARLENTQLPRPEIIALLERAMRITAHATNEQYGVEGFDEHDEADVAQRALILLATTNSDGKGL